jgi:apolipoprotein N-acyltransferase
MRSANSARLRLSAGLAVVLTAAMVWFGTGLQPLWPLLWFAPIPVLLFAARATRWQAFAVAFTSWLLGNLNLWHYLTRVIEVPAAAAIGICAAYPLIFSMAVLLQRSLLLRGRSWAAALAFPALWAAAEFVISLVSIHGTGGSVAYSQLNFLPLLQLASITGPWGITYVLMLLPSALAVSFHQRGARPQSALLVAAAGLGILVAVLALGMLRLERPASNETLKVGLIASDPPVSPQVAEPGAATAQLLNAYAEQAAKLAAAGAQVIVLPEKVGVVAATDIGVEDSEFQRVADDTGAQVVVGLIRKQEDRRYNEARWYLPGAIERNYDKEHMLPPFESNLTPGTSLAMSPIHGAEVGVAICKDMDFISPARDYGRAGVGVMLVPAFDFDDDRFMHGHMAVMRGVENGFAIARAAKMGYLTVSDDRGRVLGELTSNSAPFATLLVAVPTTHEPTLFLLWGNWFGWVSVLALLLAISRCFARPVVSRDAATRPEQESIQ